MTEAEALQRAEEVWGKALEAARQGKYGDDYEAGIPILATALAQARREGVEAMRDAALDAYNLGPGLAPEDIIQRRIREAGARLLLAKEEADGRVDASTRLLSEKESNPNGI
jgi:hypothetical protein